MASPKLLREAYDRLIELMKDPDSGELQWQALFQSNPFILTECLPLGIAPEHLIPARPGQPVADFYSYPEPTDADGIYNVIELKRPDTTILDARRKDVIQFSSDIATAVAQVQKYAFDLKASWPKPDRIVVLGSDLHMFIIAGLESDLARKVTSTLHRYQVERLLPRDCTLIPYDRLATRLARKIPPKIHMLIPEYSDIAAEQTPISSPHAPSKGHGDPTVQDALDLLASSRGFGSRRTFGPRKMISLNCSDCGAETAVPFPPAKEHPVYCRDCYQKHKPPRRF